MVGETIQIDPNTLTFHGIYPPLSRIPREIERVVVAPEKTIVKLLKNKMIPTLVQENHNSVFEQVGDEYFYKHGTNNFLGIEDVLISQSPNQPNTPANLADLLQQTEKVFGWDIKSSVWFAVGQPILGIKSFIKNLLPRHLK